ncbi:hypothetical protein G9A89_016371 [Geosiphon pyriformis]|nr:hypothetical protein G9A89_016371 [Geosiphon pyriformis]
MPDDATEISSKILLGTTKEFGVTIVEASNCPYFSELLVFLTIFFEEVVLETPGVESIEEKTSLFTGLLLKTFGLLVGVKAILGLIQVCLFDGILTGEKPAKDEEVASVATKGSLLQLLSKEKASKTFCLIAFTTERALLIEILLDISGQILGAAFLLFALVMVIKLRRQRVKGHSGIPDNVRADLAAGAASGSLFSFCADVREHFLVAENVAVSGNARHFVRNIFRSICCARWEAGSGCDVVLDAMIGCIDWVVTAKVEFSDHVFTCVHESGIRGEILAEASARWSALAGGSSASAVLWVLFQCSIDVGLYTLVCKEFVLEEWYEEACDVFEDRKVATARIVDYVRFVVSLHHAKVWLARASHWVVMEKAGLVCNVGVVSGLPCGVSSVLSDGVVRLLGLANSFAVSFGRQKSFCFFSGLDGSVRVVIDV